jgi:hypothetical protein
MKGDFSRIRFNPRKQYTAVLEQQGRVSLDADANEQAAIDGYLRGTETIDVVGEYGAPIHDAGFAITVEKDEILIGAGRYYVEGLMCENRQENLAYGSQQYLTGIGPSTSDFALLGDLVQQGGSIQVYLQVWQRFVTALDDGCLREPALGQADTTARLQTVWRVIANFVPPAGKSSPPSGSGSQPTIGTKPVLAVQPSRSVSLRTSALTAKKNLKNLNILKETNLAAAASQPSSDATPVTISRFRREDCCTQMYAGKLPQSTGTMYAASASGSSDCSCQPIPAAGYRGLENQLYRLEIHEPGDETSATLKWSRENASVVAAIQSVNGPTITVNSLGPDANLGFQANEWIEITDDENLFGETPNQAGTLYQIQSVDPTVLSITLTVPVVLAGTGANPRVRRWDQSGPSAGPSGVPLPVSAPLTLENGIQVTFRPGTYQSGDYWTIPARTASGQIDWPPCDSNGDAFQPPHSIAVYNAPLACIHWDARARQTIVQSCRRLFSPLTELTAPSAPPALHITKINWTNDAIITADQWVANGLTVTLDRAPSSHINGGNFIVTLETIFDPFPKFQQSTNYLDTRSRINLLPSTFIRSESIIDSAIAVKGSTIAWTMPYLKANLLQIYTVDAIAAGLLFGKLLGQYGRVRVRIPGRTLFADNGGSQLYLDGQSFGQPETNSDGSTRIDLRLPSGNSAEASDFESWFYVAPTLLITQVTIPYPTVFVVLNANRAVSGVTSSPPGTPTQTVVPYATIVVSYPALVDAQLTLTLSGADGIATIQSPVTIHAGETSTNATISVTGNPPNASSVTVTVHASIVSAIGPISGPTATFTITGGLPPMR